MNQGIEKKKKGAEKGRNGSENRKNGIEMKRNGSEKRKSTQTTTSKATKIGCDFRKFTTLVTSKYDD